jgi:Domain of unknown function (DUF397)
MEFRKSSYSTAQGNCVEVADLPDGTEVRDSKAAPGGPVLTFGADTWAAFVGAVKDGAFS